MVLNDRIKIIGITTIVDDSGYQEETQQELKETWCEVKPMSEKRALLQGQILGERFYFIYMRFQSFPDLNNDHFLEWGDKLLTIHSVTDLEARGHYLEIIANEKS